jgi:TolC family type I secretion outer membrane protein
MRVLKPWGPLFSGCLIVSLLATAAGAAGPPRSLDLKEALRLAWKANPALQVSRLQVLIADEEVVRARSGFLPQVRAETGYTILDDPTKIRIQGVPTIPGVVSPTVQMTNRSYWNSRVVVEQTIFDFWGIPSRYQAAVLGKKATILDNAQTRDNIFLNVCQGYFRTLRAIKLVEVARQEVAQLKDHLKIAKDQYDFGVVTYNDVLQAEVSLADAEQRLIVAKTDVVDIRSALNKVLALPVSQPTELKDERDLAVPSQDLPRLTESALKQRSDLKASQNRIQQQEKVVTQTKSQYYPTFYAQAGHTWQENDIWVHESQYFAFLGMRWSLFSGLDTRAQVAQAKDRLEQLKIQYKDLGEQVRLDVQTAHLSVRDTLERIRVTEKAVAQGEENLRLNEERYKEQVGTATDVIDAQTLLTRTRVNYTNALYDHQMAKAQLLWAMGAINELMPGGKNAP